MLAGATRFVTEQRPAGEQPEVLTVPAAVLVPMVPAASAALFGLSGILVNTGKLYDVSWVQPAWRNRQHGCLERMNLSSAMHLVAANAHSTLLPVGQTVQLVLPPPSAARKFLQASLQAGLSCSVVEDPATGKICHGVNVTSTHRRHSWWQ
jgi:hypothetical protein